MSSAPLVSQRTEQDAAITAQRVETTYLVATPSLPTLIELIAAQLEAHRFVGDAGARLSGAQQFITSVYFDTTDRSYFAAARRDQHNHVKLRAKQYYWLQPALAGVDSALEQGSSCPPRLWLELKRREGLFTSKRRMQLPKAAAARLFDQPELALLGSADVDARALLEHLQAQSEPLRPSAAVNYQRMAFQNPAGTVRVTIDLDLAFFRAPPDLLLSSRTLSRSELGAPAGLEARAVVEVKRIAALPSWLADALAATAGSPVAFSKFVAASEAVLSAQR